MRSSGAAFFATLHMLSFLSANKGPYSLHLFILEHFLSTMFIHKHFFSPKEGELVNIMGMSLYSSYLVF